MDRLVPDVTLNILNRLSPKHWVKLMRVNRAHYQLANVPHVQAYINMFKTIRKKDYVAADLVLMNWLLYAAYYNNRKNLMFWISQAISENRIAMLNILLDYSQQKKINIVITEGTLSGILHQGNYELLEIVLKRLSYSDKSIKNAVNDYIAITYNANKKTLYRWFSIMVDKKLDLQCERAVKVNNLAKLHITYKCSGFVEVCNLIKTDQKIDRELGYGSRFMMDFIKLNPEQSIKFLNENKLLNNDIIESLYITGSIKTVKSLHYSGYPCEPETAMSIFRHFLRKKNVENVKWIFDNILEEDIDQINYKIHKGYFYIGVDNLIVFKNLKKLGVNLTPIYKDKFISALECGRIKVMKWIVKQGFPVNDHSDKLVSVAANFPSNQTPKTLILLRELGVDVSDTQKDLDDYRGTLLQRTWTDLISCNKNDIVL